MMESLEQSPPCQVSCPLGQSGRDYLRLVAESRLDEAFELVYEDNPLPASCGRICHKCEPFCNRAGLDAPVRVATIKSYLADRYYASHAPRARVSRLSKTERVAVVGSGPCGLTAALRLATHGYRVTVFESMPVAGGQLGVGIPLHRLPREVVQREVENVLAAGVELRLCSPVHDVEQLFADGYGAVLVATGSHEARSHPAVNTRAPGVLVNTEFLRDTKLGRPVTIGKRVLVVGGGNVAMDCARVARRLGDISVAITCVESWCDMPAHRHEMEAALTEGIDILAGTTILEVRRGSGGGIGSVVMAAVAYVEMDGGRVVSVEHDLATVFVHQCDTILLAIGQTPRTELVAASPGVSRGALGEISLASGSFSTGRNGLFAAGDAVTVVGSVAGAIGAGNRVAAEIHTFLSGGQPPAARPSKPPAEFDAGWARQLLDRGLVSAAPRLPLKELSPDLRVGELADQEVDLGMTDAEAIAEARRCLACGIDLLA